MINPTSSRTDEHRAIDLAETHSVAQLCEQCEHYRSECDRADWFLVRGLIVGIIATLVGVLGPFGITWSLMGPILALVVLILLVGLRVRSWTNWKYSLYGQALLIKGRGPKPPEPLS